MVLLHPTYFGPISFYSTLVQEKPVLFENEDNYQKQTYRNRMYIYGANGALMLNIPIQHTKNGNIHQKYKDVRIDYSFNWQKQHWKSIQIAYRASPFFEFYEAEFQPLFEKKFDFLLDLNYATFHLVMDCLGLEINYQKTSKYAESPKDITDRRSLVLAKQRKLFDLEPYSQVFVAKNGFLSDLSILDLLFNEGPQSLDYLERQTSRI